jgi:hypothetical protein
MGARCLMLHHPPAAPPVVGSRFPLQAGAGRGRSCRSISGRRSATGRPMEAAAQRAPQIALGYPWPAAWFAGCTRDHAGGAGSGRCGALHLLVTRAHWPAQGTHTELRRSAAAPPCFPLFHSLRNCCANHSSPPYAAPDLAMDAAAHGSLLPMHQPRLLPTPHTIDRLVYHAACSALHSTTRRLGPTRPVSPAFFH